MTEQLDRRDLEDEDIVPAAAGAAPVPVPPGALPAVPAPTVPASGVARRRRGGSLVVDLHNVMGLLAAAAIIVVCVTGIVLNHLESLGITRPTAAVTEQRPPLQGARSVTEVVAAAQGAELTARGGTGDPADLDRAVWSPGKGTVDVRLDTDPVQSVIVDDAAARVLDRVERHDLDVTIAHSGQIIGDPWVILSDIVGVVLILSVVSGVIVWARRVKARRRLVGARAGTRWIRANWWFHLLGGLAASAYLIVMSVTGVLLNHKQPLNYMQSAPDLPKRDADFRPVPISEMVQGAIAFRGALGDPGLGITEVKTIDYRPKGYAKVRFVDDYEVIVDAADGTAKQGSRRWDVWIEDLHSGMLFGSKGWMLADIPAGIAILLTVNGVYLWTRPAWRARDPRPKAG